MFISFLYPFQLRGRIAPYLWIAYKQITDLDPQELAFIASEDYFIDPAQFRQQNRFETSWPENPELQFRVPNPDQLRSYRCYCISEGVYQRLKKRWISDALIWKYLIQQVDEELVQRILAGIERLGEDGEVEALLTWCNFASLKEAARRLGIPLIHAELGPLRYPAYKPLGYFDFSGVNGNTEAADRFQRYQAAEGEKPAPLKASQLLKLLSQVPKTQMTGKPDYEIGIPLQVEDDSNVLAYGRGFDLSLLLHYVLQEGGFRRILVRPHPGAYWSWERQGYDLDDSPGPWQFIQRCRQILTLNSSLALEAMLAERPVVILGESPARFAAGTALGNFRRATEAELDFLLLHYFVPYRFLFQAAYLRWRLRRPSEQEIRERHLLAHEMA